MRKPITLILVDEYVTFCEQNPSLCRSNPSLCRLPSTCSDEYASDFLTPKLKRHTSKRYHQENIKPDYKLYYQTNHENSLLRGKTQAKGLFRL